MRIAVVADVHLHDLYGGYGMVKEGSGALALRTLEDTMASTRVFNESHPAFLAVLDDIVQRGIRDVVLLGDYSDDGQLGAVAAVKAILSVYETMHGVRFVVTFGNHDCFGPMPFHQAKTLTGADGLKPALVSSDDCASEPAIVSPGMRGMSTPEAIEAMAPYGMARPNGILLHWETPFGDREDLQVRHIEGDDTSGLDASYLVEPQDGLWLLMVDANVFESVEDGWRLNADAAWDHVLAKRDYLIVWIEDVARRAAAMGKTLLAFSHYPALPLAFTGNGENRIAACTPDWQKRMPSPASGRRLASAGLNWHFSGHMHVAGRIEHHGFVNIAVPSPVAYPGGYAVVSVEGKEVDVEMIRFGEVPGFDVAFPAYREQSLNERSKQFSVVLTSRTYTEFLRAHLQNLIDTKHLPNDWSAEFLACMDVPIEQVFRDIACVADLLQKWSKVASLPLRTMAVDYYFFRAAGSLTSADIPAERIGFYRDLREAFSPDEDVAYGILVGSGFLRMFFACDL